MNAPIGRFDLVALDCPDPRVLADFYRSIVGGTIEGGPGGDGGNWIELHTPTGNIAFQRIDGHRPPTWPSGDVPQQAHIGPPPTGSGYSLKYFEVRRYAVTGTSDNGNTQIQVGAWKVFNKF